MDKGKRLGERPGTQAAGVKDLPTPEEFDKMRHRADKGDVSAQEAVRGFLDSQPELCEQLGDMADHAQRSLIRQIAGEDFMLAEAVKRKAAEMRRQLAGAFPTPLEILGAERVVATWLQLQWVQSACARVEGDGRSATFWLRREAQAAKLYNTAIKSLLLMRELLPAVGQPVLGLVDRDGTAKEPTTSRGNGRINGNGIGRVNGNGQAHPGSNGHVTNRVAVLTGNGREPSATPV